MLSPPTTTHEILPPGQWQARVTAHEARLSPWVEAHRRRTSRGERHPVYDFLFEYYSYRPGLLLRWVPGLGVTLDGEEADAFLRWRDFARTEAGVALDSLRLTERIRQTAAWIGELLRRCRERDGHFGCHGLHEWAMVYETPEVRHDSQPLRFSPDEIREIVHAQTIRCSHYDAFRFFTSAAKPLNRLQPCKETRLDLEQPGCLHTNMDLYKWAYKLAPWTPSELVAETFELARDIRKVDMRASPYDLRHLGFEPVKIETPDGRRQYQDLQRAFARRAGPLRDRLIAVCDRITAFPLP